MHTIIKPSRFIFCLTALLLLTLAREAAALQWSASPRITFGAEDNDNINLDPGPHTSTWGYNITPEITLNASAPQWNLGGHAQINRVQYPGNPLYSRTDHLLDLTYTEQRERDLWGLAGNLTRDSTLQTELSLTGIPLSARAQRSSRTLAPTWTHTLTETDSLTLAYSYNDVVYENASTISNLLNYTYANYSATLAHSLSEKNQITFSLGYDDYKSNGPLVTLLASNFSSATRSLQLGFTRSFSETLRGSLTAGIHKTNSTTDTLTCVIVFQNICLQGIVPSTSSDTGSLLNASVVQSFESSSLTTALSRSLQPTGNGGIVQSDKLSLDYSTHISPTLDGTVNFSIYHTQSPTTSSGSQDSRYYTLRPAMTWRMTEWWTATAAYNRSEQRNANSQVARANAIYLTLMYAWPTISSSR